MKAPFIEIQLKRMKRTKQKSQITEEPWLQHRQKKRKIEEVPRSNSEILVYWAAPSGRWRREFS